MVTPELQGDAEVGGVLVAPPAREDKSIAPLPHRSHWFRKTFLLIVATLLFAALALPAMVGRVYTADDLGEFQLPLRAFYARCLAAGDNFDWCPDLYGGFYLTGEGQIGAYHPYHWLLYRCLPLELAWNIECLASYPFLFAGVYLLLRQLRLPPSGGLFGALVFTFCSFNLLHFVHVNAVAVIAHVPWILWCVTRLAGSADVWSRPGTTASLALLTGSQWLLGYPQYVLYSGVAELVFLACLIRNAELIWRQAAQPVAGWLTAKSLGLIIGGVQLGATFDALADSVRQSVDASFAASGSLHPLNLVQLVAPYLFQTRVVGQNTHELSVYLGVTPLLLALLTLANRSQLCSCGRRILRLGSGLVLVGLVFALGEHTPLYSVVGHVPVLNSFRFPCRATVLIQLGIALLASYGFAWLLTGLAGGNKSNQRVYPARIYTWLLATSLGLSAIGPFLWPEFVSAPLLIWIGPLLLACGIGLVKLAALNRAAAAYGLVLFTAIDLGAYGLTYGPYRSMRFDEFVASIPSPEGPGVRIALDAASTNDKAVRAGNAVLLRGFQRVDGYAGLEPARQLDYRSLAALRISGTRWITPELAAPLGLAPSTWVEVPEPMPRARLVTRAVPSSDPRFDIARIDLQRQALVEPNAQPAEFLSNTDQLPSNDVGVGTVTIVTDRPGLLRLRIESAAPALLVLTESFHRGWSVTVNDELQTALRVNGDFLGVGVGRGVSEVTFVFQAPHLASRRAASLCGLGFCVLLYVLPGLNTLAARRGSSR